MSPGPLGYPDWQRQVNWDAPLAWSVNVGPIAGNTVSPVMTMAQLAYIGGLMSCQSGACAVTIAWYADQAATLTVGFRTFNLDPSVLDGAQLHLPNLGPYCRVTVSLVGAGTYSFSARIFGTNRNHPLEFIPFQAVLIDKQGAALGANGTVNVAPTDYFASAARVFAFCGQAAGLQLQYLNNAGAWDQFESEVLTANVSTVFTTIMPAGAWRLSLNNQTANATTYFLSVVPSTSGSG